MRGVASGGACRPARCLTPTCHHAFASYPAQPTPGLGVDAVVGCALVPRTVARDSALERTTRSQRTAVPGMPTWQLAVATQLRRIAGKPMRGSDGIAEIDAGSHR